MCGHTRDPIIYSKFHRNPFRGFGAPGGQIWRFPLLWQVAFTTACTTVQAVIYKSQSNAKGQILEYIWHSDAYPASKLDRKLKFPTFEKPNMADGRHLENQKTAISTLNFQKFLYAIFGHFDIFYLER